MKWILLTTLLLSLIPAAIVHADGFPGDAETDYFLSAKEAVFDRDWDKAQNRLESYLEHYPDGRYDEEARYWLARSFNKMSQEASKTRDVIQLKESAAASIDELLKKYPDSIWKDDAQVLRVEVAAQLALLGDEDQLVYVRETLKGEPEGESKLLVIALEALVDTGPETALPLVETILSEENDPEIRKRAVALIGMKFGNEGLPLLQQLEAEDSDPEVRKEAALWYGKVKMWSIPVELHYFGYVAKLETDQQRIPENELYVADISAPGSPSKRKAEKAVKKHFGGALSDLKFAASATFSESTELARYSHGYRTVHNLAGFLVEVPGGAIEKSHYDIKGLATFLDKQTDTEFQDEFSVNEDNARLLAARHGDRVAVLVLLFESDEEKPDRKDEPVYYTKFVNVFGAAVHSSRQSWGADEMSGAVVEYGRARAEIPGDNGLWVLVGDIQSHRKTRKFVGRGATLYNPKREVVAEASEIVVPADSPEEFEVKEK